MNYAKHYAHLTISLLLMTSCSVLAMTSSSNTIPTLPNGFGISLTGQVLAPGADNLIYAVHTKPLPLPDPSWTQEIVDPNFHPSFTLGFLYTFSSHVDQLKLNWLYLNTSDNASNNATGAESVAPPYAFGPLAQALRGSSANSTAKFKVDDVL